MIFVAIVLGFLYGYISVRGQFCMNSGFSNVFRTGNTIKLKSYILAITIQLSILPLAFTVMYLYGSSNTMIDQIGIPPLFLIGTALGGFLFGVFMYYTGGCAAGIFYKLGERNTGALLAIIGFVAGVYAMERGVLRGVKELTQANVLYQQEAFWKLGIPITQVLGLSVLIAVIGLVFIFILLKKEDQVVIGAVWGWKKTGLTIGAVGLVAWISALMVGQGFGMSIIPAAYDITIFNLSWSLIFVLGIPVGAYWSTRNNSEKKFTLPGLKLASRRLFGGVGLGASASMAAGCTVGHGLTFTPLLGVGSIVGIIFIFLGSGMMGYLTRQ